MIIIMLNFISEQKINHLKTRIRCLMIVSASLFHHFHVALLGDGVFFFKPCRTLYCRRSQTKDNEETKALRRCKGRRRRRTKRKAELERREREREVSLQGFLHPTSPCGACEPLAYFSLLHFL